MLQREVTRRTSPLDWELGVFLRLRKSPVLSSLYRVLPEVVRAKVSKFFWRRLERSVSFPPLPAFDSNAKPARQVIPAATLERAGVNLYGYFNSQFGLGESARLYARALAGAGVPVAITDLDLNLPHHRSTFDLAGIVGDDAVHDIDLIIVNPDYLPAALEQIAKVSPRARYRMACWFWELELVPAPWRDALDLVDEIMVASSFVEDAFRRITDKPLLRAPLPVFDIEDSGLTRRDFGLPEGAYVFLASFDFHSSISRKNPYAVIHAFQRAFADGADDVVLVVKSSNGIYYPEALNELVSYAKGDTRILIRDEVIDAAHLRSLQRCSDSFVSLHRAEGFGLGLAECMAMAKPVVATAWSGNMEFMSSDDSCLVDFTLVPVKEGEYPNASGARWAEPDIGQAAEHMRRLARDPEYSKELGERGALAVRSRLAPSLVAAMISQRLDELTAQMSQSRSEAARNIDQTRHDRNVC